MFHNYANRSPLSRGSIFDKSPFLMSPLLSMPHPPALKENESVCFKSFWSLIQLESHPPLDIYLPNTPNHKICLCLRLAVRLCPNAITHSHYRSIESMSIPTPSLTQNWFCGWVRGGICLQLLQYWHWSKCDYNIIVYNNFFSIVW